MAVLKTHILGTDLNEPARVNLYNKLYPNPLFIVLHVCTDIGLV